MEIIVGLLILVIPGMILKGIIDEVRLRQIKKMEEEE